MAGDRVHVEPFFLAGELGSLFCLLRCPSVGPPKGGVLYLHPFAEEMHKSRRMAAVQAEEMAASGWVVLQVDLTGCGDSAGDFSDATWSAWRDDVARAWTCLNGIVRSLPCYLWGLRIGATLAAQMSTELSRVSGLLLWQPVICGEIFLNQFLRIRLAGEMLADRGIKNNTKHLREILRRGEVVEVGGFGLSSVMARELTDVKLSESRPYCPVAWFEVGAMMGDGISHAGQTVLDAWGESFASCVTATVSGDPFWITQEITECRDLLALTRSVFDHWEGRLHET